MKKINCDFCGSLFSPINKKDKYCPSCKGISLKLKLFTVSMAASDGLAASRKAWVIELKKLLLE